MSFTYRDATFSPGPLLVGISGGTGSGKTYSAMRLARGIAKGEPFHVIDTENGRALMYADDFDFKHGELHAPFRPSRYADAIEAAEKDKAHVVVVDSASHAWAGDGGCLDWQEQLMRGEESRRLLSWVEPKRDHRRFITRLLQIRAHVILCFRAEPKVEVVTKNGKMEIVPKVAAGKAIDGWIPISEKMLPYEMTVSFLLMADAPGIPKPIKIPKKLRPLVPLDSPLDESIGLALAEWAAGSGSGPQSGSQSEASGASSLAGLTLNELLKNLEDPTARSAAERVGAKMFAGMGSAADLTDAQRASLWAAVQKEMAS